MLEAVVLLLSVLLLLAQNVAARRSNRAPRILTVEDPKYFVLVGATGLLECKVKGRPKPSVKWLKDGQPVRRVSKYYIQNEETKSLRIFNSELRDAGNFTCVAKNKHGVDMKNFYLPVVQYPRVTVWPRPPVAVKEGDNLNITCQSYAFPGPTYSWITSRDLRLNSFSRPVDRIESRYTVRDSVLDTTHTKSVLSITPVTHLDYGLFVCFSGNKGSSTRAEIMLDVQFAPKSVDAKAGERQSVHYHQMDTGQPFNLSCAATGNDLPTIHWFYNGRPLDTSHCPVMRNPPQIRSFACSITETTMGLYACYAENSQGRVLIQEFEVAPLYAPPPLTLFVDSAHANRVTLTAPLGIPNTPDPNYVLISYRLLLDGKPSPRRRDVYETTADLNSQGETTVLLPGLKEHASYSVTVASKNRVGLGPEVKAIIQTGTLVSVIDDLVRLAGISGDIQLLETSSQARPETGTPRDLADMPGARHKPATGPESDLEDDAKQMPVAPVDNDDNNRNNDDNIVTGVRSNSVDDEDDDGYEHDPGYREATAYSVLGRDSASSSRVSVLVLLLSWLSVKFLENVSFS